MSKVDLSKIDTDDLIDEVKRRDEWPDDCVSDFDTDDLIEELEKRGCLPNFSGDQFQENLREICAALDRGDRARFAVLLDRIQTDAGIEHPAFFGTPNLPAPAASELRGTEA